MDSIMDTNGFRLQPVKVVHPPVDYSQNREVFRETAATKHGSPEHLNAVLPRLSRMRFYASLTCLSRIEKSQILTDRNVTKSLRGGGGRAGRQ
jgi:hypothetical protein